jgi:MoaA/NifB/PqqE/SkfB family radical SAM enzyme
METNQSYPIDRVLFETTEFCVNNCYFCYGDYGPNGRHMPPEQFSFYLTNLMEGNLLHPESLLILFGGEILNHPECLEICRIAAEKKKPSMNLVIITSGKFLDEFTEQVEALKVQINLVHHWEVSIKDFESFEFGLDLIKKGHMVLFRYDYLHLTDLKKCMQRFFKHVKMAGIWKQFEKNNRGLEKRLRRMRQDASPDMVFIEEFFYPNENNNCNSTGLVFSPLDRGVLRTGAKRSEVQCSLFDPQYRSAVHVTHDGTLYPCHLPRFKKACQPLGNVGDREFINSYGERIPAFKSTLEEWQRRKSSISGTCVEGCRHIFRCEPAQEECS